MAEGEEEVQEMQSPMAASSGKKKKNQQWISILQQEILKELNLP